MVYLGFVAFEGVDTDGDTSGGIPLTEDMPILLEIAQYFTNIDNVTALAVYLLYGVGSGGKAYVDSLNGSTEAKAHAVLVRWSSKKPENATGAKLYSVLKNKSVSPSAAVTFCKALMPGKILA